MNSGEEKLEWNVFDGVKKIPVAPEALMAEINSAITTLEYARASALLQRPSPPSVSRTKSTNRKLYDARVADEAYKAGLASMAAGKLDEAVVSLNVALSKCPPDSTSAVAKLKSLISVTSQQLQDASK